MSVHPVRAGGFFFRVSCLRGRGGKEDGSLWPLAVGEMADLRIPLASGPGVWTSIDQLGPLPIRNRSHGANGP